MTSRTGRATPDVTLAVAYLRSSTEQQDLGPQAQRTAIEAWATSKGITVVSWHEDRLSGATPVDERPGLLSAIESVRTNHAGVLVASTRSRLAREVGVAAVLERLVADLGARVETSDGVSAEASPEGRLMRNLMDAFSEFERSVLRARTTAALAVKKARGERISGRAPVGYRFEGAAVVVDDAEQRLLARARHLRSAGLSIRRVCSILTATGATFRGGRIHETTMARALRVSA